MQNLGLFEVPLCTAQKSRPLSPFDDGWERRWWSFCRNRRPAPGPVAKDLTEILVIDNCAMFSEVEIFVDIPSGRATRKTCCAVLVPGQGECQQRRNKRIARARARVEQVFGAIEQMGGKLLRTIGYARSDFAMTMMATCYNLKRLVYIHEAGIEVFCRPIWAEPPLPEAIQGGERWGATMKTSALRINRTGFGRVHRCEMAFIESLVLFKVP